jgi:hypothetical protein
MFRGMISPHLAQGCKIIFAVVGSSPQCRTNLPNYYKTSMPASNFMYNYNNKVQSTGPTSEQLIRMHSLYTAGSLNQNTKPAYITK